MLSQELSRVARWGKIMADRTGTDQGAIELDRGHRSDIAVERRTRGLGAGVGRVGVRIIGRVSGSTVGSRLRVYHNDIEQDLSE